MASTASVLSSLRPAQADPARSRTHAPRRVRRAWLQLLRDTIGGALLLAAWLALWTVTWAAVAGPLSPARDARAPVVSADATL